MKLSLSIIKEQLGNITKHCNFSNYSCVLHLPRPLFYSGEAILHSDTLYISSTTSLPREITCLAGSALICIGPPPPNYFNENLDLLVLDESEDIFVLSNKICKIYNLFDSLDANFQEIVNQRKPLQDFLDIAEPLFENPLSIMDSDFNVIARSQSFASIQNRFNQGVDRSRIPLEQVNLFKFDKTYQEIKNEKKVFIYPAEHLPFPTLCKNIFLNDTYVFRITVFESTHEFRDSDASLLDFISTYLKPISEYYFLNQVQNSYLVSLLQTIIAGNSYNHYEYNKELEKIGWNEENTYCIADIRPSSHDQYNSTITYFCNIIMRDFKNTLAFIHNYHVVILINLDNINENREDYFNRFKYFIRDQ